MKAFSSFFPFIGFLLYIDVLFSAPPRSSRFKLPTSQTHVLGNGARLHYEYDKDGILEALYSTGHRHDISYRCRQEGFVWHQEDLFFGKKGSIVRNAFGEIIEETFTHGLVLEFFRFEGKRRFRVKGIPPEKIIPVERLPFEEWDQIELDVLDRPLVYQKGVDVYQMNYDALGRRVEIRYYREGELLEWRKVLFDDRKEIGCVIAELPFGKTDLHKLLEKRLEKGVRIPSRKKGSVEDMGFRDRCNYYLAKGIFLAGVHLPIPTTYGDRISSLGARMLNPEEIPVSGPNEVFTVGEKGSLRDDVVIFVNGVNTYRHEAERMAASIATSLSHQVICVYTSTQGLGRDLIEVYMEQCGYDTESVEILRQEIQQQIERGISKIYLFCHSRGALITYNALKILPKDLRQRIEIYAFGPAKILPLWLGGRVVNYRASNDYIPYFDSEASFKKLWFEITCLPSRISGFDHSFMGETYQTEFLKITKEILSRYG